MNRLKRNHGKLSPVFLCLSLALAPPASQAAEVPFGTVLASKQEIVRNNNNEPASLDPHKVESDTEFSIINDCFEGLVGLDALGDIAPRLASRWEQSDNTVWTLHLRPNLKWSNGEPLTAADIVYSWQRLIDPQTASPYESYLASMNVLNAQAIIEGRLPPQALGVKALDDNRVQVTLSQPLPYFLQMLSNPVLAPLNKGVIEGFGIKWTQPENIVSSGAFKPSLWIVNEKIEAVKNPHYWDSANTVLQKITYLPIASESAEVNRYKAGEIDITRNVPEIQFAALQKELGSQVRVTRTLETHFYELNTRKPPFDDRRVRLALNLALDKSILAEKVMGQGQTPAHTFTPQNTGGFNFTPAEYTNWPPARRIAEAKKLLSQAGFGPGNPLKFSLIYNTSESSQRVAIAVSSMWKKSLGAEVSMFNQEWKTMLDTMHGDNFDVIRSSWKADYNDPSTYLNLYRSGDSGNCSKYANPQYDQALQNAITSTSYENIKRYYQQAEDILSQDSPMIPLYHNVAARLVKPYVGGYRLSLMGFIDSKDLYVVSH